MQTWNISTKIIYKIQSAKGQRSSGMVHSGPYPFHPAIIHAYISFLSTFIPFLLTYAFITILSAYQACEIGSETRGNYSEVIQ